MKDTCIDLKYAKLHIIKTKKFRTINVKVVLRDEIKKEDITKRNFLTDYLVLTTKKYKTKKELALKTQELYSLYIGASNSRIGNYLVTTFNMSLLDPKYTESGMLEESFDLLHEIIFNPNVNNQEFDSKIFNSLKKEIEAGIKTIKENPQIYANIRMLENMDSNSPYSYQGFGYLEDLEKITTSNLYQYYKDFISKSIVDIYVIGDVTAKELSELVKAKLNFKTMKKEKKDVYIYHNKARRPKEIIEKENLNQSKLAIGVKLIDLNDFERKYVINMYNMILGGGFNSKFMQIIREKESLAYYINSKVNKSDNLIIIQSGISFQNYKKVINHIKNIMKRISKGEITDEELENVKMEYLTVLEEINDSIDNILENYISRDILNLDDFETRKEMIKKVTLDDIIKVSKKVYIDTIYLLKGELNEKN